MKMRTALEGVGAALLLLFPYYLPLFQPQNLALYHHRLPVTNLVGGLLVDMLGFSILAIGFLIAAQYLRQTPQRILNALFAGFLLWCIVDVVMQINTASWRMTYWNYMRRQSCISICLLSGILAYFVPRITQPAVRAVRLLIAASAFSAVWIVPHLLHLAMVHPPDEVDASSHLPSITSSGTNQRIIWILFDELSYDQTFDHPSPGIQLPNFDRLRTQSFSFSNLKPAGYRTDSIIPSLFLGRRIDQIRSTINGTLWYKDESQNRWLAFDPAATLFGLAQLNGWSSGIDGWSNPYCRILAPVLNACFWEPNQILPMEAYGASEEESIWANAAVLPSSLFAMWAHHSMTPRDGALQGYGNEMVRTHALIACGQVRFVFLHLPVPHPPGIYDRKNHLLRPGGTYLDNLVLADDTLGALLQEIDATPSVGQTTVIVSSDHSWRIPLWRDSKFWSEEEERASGGRFDDRPVLLIHFPHQESGSNVNTALPELLEHDIIAAMLRGQINDQNDLAAFLPEHGR
jgi:hypothetical protein